jgi:cytochrome c peroxidase
LILDGKAVNPQQMSHGVVTGTNVPAATLIPPAFGLAGVNLHTWTGWGSVPYWNAFVAVLEMHGKGSFFDPRLDDPIQFPVAARAGFGNVSVDEDEDLVTSKLPALHFYQMSLAAPTPPAGSFDPAAAARGDAVFNGPGKCQTCHKEPLFTEPGWNLHAGSEIGIDNFQADRAPDHKYRTSPLKGLFSHQKGGFFHDGRFPTLLAVVQHYNTALNLNLTTQQMNDLVEYLKSL